MLASDRLHTRSRPSSSDDGILIKTENDSISLYDHLDVVPIVETRLDAPPCTPVSSNTGRISLEKFLESSDARTVTRSKATRGSKSKRIKEKEKVKEKEVKKGWRIRDKEEKRVSVGRRCSESVAPG